MSVLSDNYKRIMSEIEEKVSNPEEFKFIKEKFLELSTLFMDVIDNLANKTDTKIAELEKKQKFIELKISQVEGAVDEIENDIYLEDDEESDFDFEIVCPYCNYEFVAEISGKSEISCPECNNIIELEWNDDEYNEINSDECTKDCHACNGCNTNEIKTENVEENNEQNQEDDM